ncbi:MAG: small multi-drug export protein [Desulfamplus sp.]|nr:small multi-drug export protein [Desulfamplus sp.]
MESKPIKLHDTTEGKIFFIGVILTILLIFIIGYHLILDPSKAKVLTLVFVAHAFGGRAVAVGLCIINDLNVFPTIIYNFFIEIQLLCVTYSIFVLSITNYIKIQWVQRIANHMMQNADKHRDKIKRYGWIGIFLFVLAPLPGTGPVAGSILGYLLKMNIWRNFTAVLSGTFFAILMWVVCFDFLQNYLYIIQYILVFIIAFVVFSNFKNIKSWFTKQEENKVK